MPEEKTQQIPEDIFDDANKPQVNGDAAPSSSVSQAVEPQLTQTAMPPPPPHEETVFDEVAASAEKSKLRIWLWLILGIVAVGLAGAAVYFVWTQFSVGSVAVQEQNQLSLPVNAGESSAETETVSPLENKPEVRLDTDGDGLADVEEAAKGTDPNRADTDEDGLTDNEEIVFYDTNPLNKDTDNDTYLDGTEVRNGYNPNGDGKLFVVPAE